MRERKTKMQYLKCIRCDERLELECFSKNQRQKGLYARCLECTCEIVMANIWHKRSMKVETQTEKVYVDNANFIDCLITILHILHNYMYLQYIYIN